jgi:hypothetical protein
MKEIVSSIENPNFNSFWDISQYKWPIPKNFCRKWKEIGRANLTSIEQQQIKIINDCLYKHQELLWIVQKKTISLDDVIFVDTVDVDWSLTASMMTIGWSWWFLTILKKIFYDRKSKGYFEDNIHEWIHYIWFKDGTLKSWFSTVSQEKKTNNWETYREKYFEFVDEWIVTKIAREIVKNNPEGQKFFDKYYLHKENIEYDSEEEFQKVKMVYWQIIQIWKEKWRKHTKQIT